MRYYFPPNATAVIFHFHGSGGSANGLFQNPEQFIFAREAVAEGYAIVSLSSFDRINGQWNPSNQINTNPDMQNVQTAINTFISRGLMTASTPVFASGISNGGAFAPRVSLALNFRGTAIFIASGTVNVMSTTTVPTIWCLMQNDQTIGASGIQQARDNFANLVSRNIRAEFNLNPPSPVYPERFWRIAGLTQTDSQAIHNALKANGILDQRDFQRESPYTSGWQNFIPAQYSAFNAQILTQLELCWTEHKFFSDYNRRVLNFFNSLL
jgi:poly(3-hydroxybutyrate) depolymerase